MGLTIDVLAGHRLQLTGDIATVLDLSARAIVEGFSLAISDGSLVRGSIDAGGDGCRFARAVEGAAVIKIARGAHGDRLDIDGQIEWLTLASGSETLCSVDADDGADGRQLVLDIGVKAAA